jgi:hypothetical protein
MPRGQVRQLHAHPRVSRLLRNRENAQTESVENWPLNWARTILGSVIVVLIEFRLSRHSQRPTNESLIVFRNLTEDDVSNKILWTSFPSDVSRLNRQSQQGGSSN